MSTDRSAVVRLTFPTGHGSTKVVLSQELLSTPDNEQIGSKSLVVVSTSPSLVLRPVSAGRNRGF